MASVFHIECDASQIITHIINKDRECETDRNNNHFAALVIQKVYRGYRARKGVQELHHAATVIQKYFRRFLVRINMDNYMLAFIQHKAFRYYDKMAMKIQAAWKGYKYRTNVLDFRKIYEHKLMVASLNAEMIERIRKEKLRAAQEAKVESENEAKALVLFILFKLHHFLRTDIREGVYSLHGRQEYSWLEKLVKSIKFTDYMKALRELYNKSYKPPKEKRCILKGRWKECEKAYYKRDRRDDRKPLPPEDPFKYADLHKKPFCFDPRFEKKYEPYLLTQGKFKYRITTVLRDLHNELNIGDTDFDITKKMVDVVSKVPPYYIDFWNQTCNLHNFVDD